MHFRLKLLFALVWIWVQMLRTNIPFFKLNIQIERLGISKYTTNNNNFSLKLFNLKPHGSCLMFTHRNIFNYTDSTRPKDFQVLKEPIF